MDGKRLPPAPAVSTGKPIPAFVFACLSERFFASPLRAAGSEPLLTTRAYIAPEGYILRAAVEALGDNAPIAGVRDRVVGAYARWHGISPASASRLFSPTSD